MHKSGTGPYVQMQAATFSYILVRCDD